MQLAKCLALLCLATLAHSKPAPDLDPMIALPSDSSQQPEVRYVTYQPSEEAHVTTSTGHQPEVVVEYQVQPSERQMSAPYQLMQVALAPQHQPEVGQEQQVSGRDYPGEIIYVNQSGAGEQAEQQKQQQQQQYNSGLSALAEHAGMSATILTEIPVRDMPIEVLNKLKREYGVKVVATRERPGANLVINCEEHSTNVENSICARQQQQQPHEIVYAYHQRQPAMEHTYEPAGASQYVQVQPDTQEQPATQAEPQHVYVSSHAGEAQAHELGHTYRGGEVVEVVHEQSAPGEQPQEENQTTSVAHQQEPQSQPESGAQNYYGTRATTVAVDDSPAAVTQPEAVAEHEQPTQGESHSIEAGGHEAAAENVGFDEQPKVEEGAERTK